jgi:hypothetical protein
VTATSLASCHLGSLLDLRRISFGGLWLEPTQQNKHSQLSLELALKALGIFAKTAQVVRTIGKDELEVLNCQSHLSDEIVIRLRMNK